MANKYTLSILKHYPLNDSIVETDTDIKVWLSAEIQEATLNDDTFYVTSEYGNAVAGGISYNSFEQVITFSPDKLQQSTYYSVHINGIKDFDDDVIVYDYSFKTNALNKIEPPRIIKPVDNSVVQKPEIQWEDLDAESYIVEIATDYDFKNIVLSSRVFGTTIKPNVPADNTYHARIKVSDKDLTIVHNKEYNIDFNSFEEYGELYSYTIGEPIDSVVRIFDSNGNPYEIKNEQIYFQEGFVGYIHNKYTGQVVLNIPQPDSDLKFTFSINIIEEELSNDYSDIITFYYESMYEESFDNIFDDSQDSTTSSNITLLNGDEGRFSYTNNEILFKIDESLINLDDVEMTVFEQDVFDDYKTPNDTFRLSLTSSTEGGAILSIAGEFQPNTTYFITITAQSDYNTTITTMYSPYYSSYKRVSAGFFKEVVGDTDRQEIEEEIYFNSLAAIRIAENYDNMWQDDEVTQCAIDYVTKLTQYNLLKKDFLVSSSSFDEAKIADFTLKAGSSQNSGKALDTLWKDLEKLKDCIKGRTKRGEAKQQSFLKAENSNPYTLGNREFGEF